MFFNIGSGEMLLIAVALLIAVGPEQLPSLVRRVGQLVGQFRSMSDRLRADFTAGMDELDRATDLNHWTNVPTPDFSASESTLDSSKAPNWATADAQDAGDNAAATNDDETDDNSIGADVQEQPENAAVDAAFERPASGDPTPTAPPFAGGDGGQVGGAE